MATGLTAEDLSALQRMVADAVAFSHRERDLKPEHARHDKWSFGTAIVLQADEKYARIKFDEEQPGVTPPTVALASAVNEGQRVFVGYRPAGGAMVLGAAPATAGPAQQAPPRKAYAVTWGGVLATGVLSGRYRRTVDDEIIFKTVLTYGSGTRHSPTSAVNQEARISVPFPALGQEVVRGWLGGNDRRQVVGILTNSTVRLYIPTFGGNTLDPLSTTVFTPAAGSTLIVSGTYEPA